jgi:MFS family permease
LEPAWFGSRAFTGALLATFASGAAAAVVFIVPPFVLHDRWGLEPWEIGLVGIAAPAGLVIASKWSGSQLKPRGPRTLMVWGIALMVGALACLALTASGAPLAVLVVLLVVFGAGGGLFQPANIAAVIAAASAARQATIGAAQRMVPNFGIAFGAMVSAALVTAAQGRHPTSSLESSVAGAWAFAATGLLVSLGLVMVGRARTAEASP